VTAVDLAKFWDSGRRPLAPYARAAVLVALSLMALGVLMVYSASSTRAGISYHTADGGPDSEYFLRRQLVWAVIGVATLFFTMRFDYRRLEAWAKPAIIVSIVLLAVVLVPHVGHTTKGAQRWFRIGPMSFQPSELVKLTLVVWLAAHLAKAGDRLNDWKTGVLPAAGPLALAALLVIVEPDLGTALFLAAVGAAMMLVGGVPPKKLALLSLAAVPVVAWQIAHRWEVVVKRFSVFGGGAAGAVGGSAGGEVNHQVKQSLIALGSGGVFGRGIGAGMQKLLYLPEAHTDFILPVLGEELGFVGTALVVLLFAGFVVCGLKIAIGTARRDRFGFLLAFGWVFCIGLQAAGNIAVVTGSVPTKGIALPFLSLGGSSLVVLCAALGLMYAVAARHDAEEFGGETGWSPEAGGWRNGDDLSLLQPQVSSLQPAAGATT
jgi:cell division protein FtsW